MQNFSVIIVAAGSGTRFGHETPKQFLDLGGKSVMRRSIDVFLQFEELRSLCVVINPAHMPHVNQSIEGLDDITIISGGNTRQESVYNGLNALKPAPDEIVLVHDAARPFVEKQDIENLVAALMSNEAATLASPVVDTVAYTDDQNFVQKYASRENLWGGQTPQGFRAGVLSNAHEQANKDILYTDDTALVAAQGHKIKYVACSRQNFKITQEEDLILAQKLLSMETYVGTGFDVHAFDDAKQSTVKTVRLCGVDVAHDRALKGHSDADVGLHALTDAILGAIGEGDIGLHFPPSNNDFKNMDSAIFLEHAIKLMQMKGGSLVHADVTLICERPKIGDYRDDMVQRMAQIMGVSSARVNIKATTTEKLGFTGRKEGIAAQAAVSIKLPTKDDC